jgi:hypothetical protein
MNNPDGRNNLCGLFDENRNVELSRIQSVGCSITYVLTPDRYGNFKNIALTFTETQ